MTGTFFTVAEVVTRDIEVFLTHQFVFDEVLNVLDMNEGLVASAHVRGDGLGNLGGRSRVEFEGEEGAGNGLFDLGFGPGDDIAIATDKAHGHFVRFFIDGDFASAFKRAFKDEGLGNVVRVVLDEGFFDEKIEVVLAELQITAALDLTHERGGDAVSDG